MSKYVTCPHCGAHLDFGERCDCYKERATCPLYSTEFCEANELLIECGRVDGAVSALFSFETEAGRNAYFQTHCIEAPESCPIYQLSTAVPLLQPEEAHIGILARIDRPGK